MSQDIILIADNIRSCHNVGSLMRTAEGLGCQRLYLAGYTPYPALRQGDTRPGFMAAKLSRQIHKTALGAEDSLDWRPAQDIKSLIQELRQAGYKVAALEQADTAQPLNQFKVASHQVIIVGNEVSGLAQEVLRLVDQIIFIPMFGNKESFNVTVGAAMALYHCRFKPSIG